MVAEDEEEAKLRAKVEKIGILAVANTDANVLLVTGRARALALALVPVGVDMPNT